MKTNREDVILNMFIVIAAVIFSAIVAFILKYTIFQPPYKIGDCVRELGYSNIAKVTAVAPSGYIELTFRSDYKDSYDTVAQERLIKVECPNE